MKLQEFQVWYHTFNNTISALGSSGVNDYERFKSIASDVANFVTDEFKKVPQPDVSSVNIQEFVNNLSQNLATGNKNDKSKKR